ncbi:hypothetical protein CBR_g28022 [Chara braunii]|uniref:DUF659 domain-containing protein n=1 Tax=Chara braunii TaxID=69332 RepID=A0A388L903_CHABU|nr:hypothetical protein CBR_g28022 [Chara braunii]|eukprot:GBG78799.1 hypothetical protein CBR_g28022 [Chara braunii]
MASSSGAGTSSGKEVAGSDDKATRVKEPFQPQPEARQLELRATKVAFRWLTQGQMVPPLAKGQHKVKCNLCGANLVASDTRVWPHFTRKTNPCPVRYPELLHILAAKGHAIECKKTLRLIQLYRMEHNIPHDGLVPAIPEVEAQGDTVDAFIVPPTARPSRTVRTAEVDKEEREGVVEEGGGMLGTSAQGSAAGQKSGNLTRTSIKRWVTNDSQQRLDVAWGMHLFRHDDPFNYVRTKETHDLHNLYLELGEKRQRVKMPSLEVIRTVVLDIIYNKVQKDMHPLKAKWDNTGCTLLTDGSTDRRYKPVMNFIGADESGAILLKVVDVPEKKKIAVALAMMWDHMIRDIGVHRVNAICTNNAEVNKQAARILRRRTNRDISSIPWVPCATHYLNLLMKDVCELEWVKEVVQRTKMMVKFIRKHHNTNNLYTRCSNFLGNRP